MNIKLDADTREGEETLHLLHPDGTMTVQFITTDGVAEGYITHGDEQQFIDDASGSYITSDGSTQFILALHQGSQLITPEVTEEEEFLPVECLEEEADDNTTLEVNQTLHEDGKEKHVGDGINVLLGNPTNVTQEQEEQEKRQCANCFSKLIFQRGRSKKLSDPLYPYKGFTTPSSHNVNKHMDKEVTVLEALDLLFDLKIKSLSSSIRLCNDYVFCYKCVSCLLKLHTLFVEFTVAAKSPSFMRSIFSQYGVLNEFSNAIKDVKIKTEAKEDNELSESESSIPNEKELQETVPDLSTSKLSSSTSLVMAEKTVEPAKRNKHKEQVQNKIRATSPPSPQKSTRLPRSCKKPQNYQALAKVGLFESEPAEENLCLDDNNDDSIVDSQGSVEANSFEKLTSTIPHKKRRSRLIDLKKRIKAMTVHNPCQGEKRKPGRPRKSPSPRIALKDELEELRPLKKRKFDSADIKIKEEVLTDNDKDVDEAGVEVTDAEHQNSQQPTAASRPSSPNSSKEILPSDVEDNETEDDEDYSERDLKYVEKVRRPRGIKKSIQCSKCCARFLKHSHYIDHLSVHSEDKLSCSECNGTFNSPRNLKRHVSLYHTVRPKRLPMAREFTCPECSFSFTRKSHLKAHLINQHNIDPDTIIGDFPCPVCGKKNFSDSVLQGHLERKHLVRVREKKNECEECGRKFLKKSDLDNHTTTHTNIRRFMCEVCGFSSKRPQDLTRHRKLVHLKEVKHTCQTCGKGFLSLWQLKSHQLSHDEFKGFPCPEPGCGKSFRCPNNLRQHIHVHQGVKHVCQYCGESYSRTAYLQRHIKINHLGISVPPIKPRKVRDINNPILQRGTRPKKPKKTYELLDTEMDMTGPEPLELDIDLPTVDGQTQVILHGFDDRYEGVIMEYIIG